MRMIHELMHCVNNLFRRKRFKSVISHAMTGPGYANRR